MLTIRKNDNRYVARNGKAECILPILETLDPKSGRSLVETVSPSGIRSLFRTAIDVKYTPVRTQDDEGNVTTSFVPSCVVYDDISLLLVKLAQDKFAGQLVRVSRIKDQAAASRELAVLMDRTISRLYKQRWDWSGDTSYESFANTFQAILLDGQMPRIKGKFLAEMDADRRLQAAKGLMKSGLLSSLCATGTGDPGRSYYLPAANGYSPTELCNPLVHEMPEKRRGVVNAIKNAVDIVGEEPSPVPIQGVDRTPSMTNAIVVCMPLALNDSVIISRNLADKLTAKIQRSNWHCIDGVINYRGGLRPTGRNGRLVKREAEWPIGCVRKESQDGGVTFSRRTPRSGQVNYANCDTELLRELRSEYEAKWAGLIQKLGAYSPDECGEWRAWLAHQPRWTQRNAKRCAYRRYGFGVERVDILGTFFYREDLGISYVKPEVGMKLQSDGDLFKGVVSKILPDDKMPVIRLAGKLIRAEVICEMGGSTAKHGSLRFAHGQMALYAVAKHTGGLGIAGQPTVEDIADLAVENGIYGDDSLTCEVFDATGNVSLGYFPAGITRVCRHKQDPSVVSSVKGHPVASSWHEGNSIHSAGCVNGLPDTACMLAAGLKECARELRSDIPSGVALKLELLRNAISQ